MDKDYEEFLEAIKKIIKKTEKRFEEFGMINETASKAINGERVKLCPYCHTPNMVIIYDDEHIMWECLKCGKTWLEMKGG